MKKNGLLKSILYRIYSSGITFIISFIISGKLALSISIGVFDLFVKIFTYYLFDEIWDKITGYKIKPSVIWLTGLSGSGKTTIANDLIVILKKKAIVPVLLDGDEIRHAIKLHGFDEDSRKKHNLNVGYIASLFEKQGNVVIVSLISPYDDVRDEVRKMCNHFIEVYVATDLETCIKRDPKGLYKKAQAGEIKDFTGISAPYYEPKNPELKIDTTMISSEESAKLILKLVRKLK
jgi:adenylylsulfate kinase